MIGKIYNVLFSYYDASKQKMAHKKRPVLIIGIADETGDYVIYPISRVTNSNNLSQDYDIKIDPQIYPNTKLNALSYVRTHKRSTVHRGELSQCICDLKSEYNALYLTIVSAAKKFDEELIAKAI